MKNFLLTNIYSLLINIFLLFFLLIAIQNNHQKKNIKVFQLETIELPISFIIGSSFITGSLVGNLVFSIINFEKRAKIDYHNS